MVRLCPLIVKRWPDLWVNCASGVGEMFRLREERDLAIDPIVKTELHAIFHGRLEQFLNDNNLKMTHAEFLAATRENDQNWRRNPRT
jgi:hypothetical protein